MKKNRIIIALMSLVITFTAVVLPPNMSVTAAEEQKTEYVVKEDAYLRNGSNANKNYNFENITGAHGAQYEGKGYKVINTKYQDATEIISVMKFDLPSAEDIATQKFDKFEFQFNIFKNADYNSGNQDYVFRYTTDTTWSESAITWNNRPTTIDKASANTLFTFHIDKGVEYEKKEESEKVIRRDITDTVEQLVSEGVSEITVYVAATTSLNTSLMMHSKETADEEKRSRIIASNDGIKLQSLKDLVAQVSTANESEYTSESFALFTGKLEAAKALITSNSEDLLAIRIAYQDLKTAHDSLVPLVDPNDAGNIAYKKPVRSNLSKQQVSLVNDGDAATYWSGIFFPAYVDIDLMDTYDINKVSLFLPIGKKSYYTLYGSNDGKNYERIYQTRDAKAATAEGDQITFDVAQSYRIVRVYMEFTDGDNKAYLSEVKVYGSKTNTNVETLRDGSLEDILDAKAYDETAFNLPVTEAETIENVYGIIDRTIGAEYRSWFTFELADKESEKDYFELSDKSGKVHIKGNEGLSLTTGLNYYFKNYAKVHISEQAMQVDMPDNIVSIAGTVRKETPYKVRYAFNYCTLNYTFAFFGEEAWQKENDWLALNGVNVVLDLAGQEATWIKFLMNYGYSFDDAKDWLTGPSYYAWQFMDNMESFGGPVPDGYVKDRLELARNTQRWKTSLGMQTVLQGYAGMVPTNFSEYQPDVEVIVQGKWNGFDRPYMIATDSPEYDEYAKKFYEAQEFVYGKTTDYYAVDPFHEGGKRPQGLTDDIIAKEVLESLLEYDENAVWVVQGWQSNPTNSLLKGMGENRKDHVLIVDLIKYPIKSWTKYNKLKYDNTTLDSLEFNGTSWAWCLLANFGGNPSMHGQMDVMVEDILSAQKTSSHMQGIGIISEATYDNPIMYELIFDLAWADETFDLSKWMDNYIERRYGGISENARLAWKTMRNSNYDYGVRFTNEVFGMKNKTPQSYGTQNIAYGADKLETAFKLLVEDYDKFKDSAAYRYDLTEIMRQVVSNYAVLTYNDVLKAKDDGSLEAFVAKKEEFLSALDILNEVQSTQKEQLGGEWIGKASDLAENYDDFAKDTFEMNSKTLITTWGSRESHGALKDYGWRNYEGIFLDVYKPIWVEYLDKVEKNLADGTPIKTISVGGYFNFYWDWIMGDQEYTRDAKDSPEEIKAVVDLVLANCSITDGLDPNIGNLALDRAVKINTKKLTGKAASATDGTIETQVKATATKDGDKIVYPEISVDLIGEFDISKVNLVLDNADDTYYHYEVYASSDNKNWEKIGEKKTNDLHADEGDVIEVSDCLAKFIKVVGKKDSKHLDDASKTEIAIKELRVYGEKVLPTLDQLETLIQSVEKIDFSANSKTQIDRVEALTTIAKTALENTAAPDEVNTVYWDLYEYVVSLNLSSSINVAKAKPVSAHNDPSGNSQRVNDGSDGTHWDSGRLSATGKPYEETITPGWVVIDLKEVYNIDEVKMKFANNNTWHMYEIHTSLDNENWDKIGEKATKAKPNGTEDNYEFEGVKARYVKVKTTNIQLDGSNKRSPYHLSEVEVYGTLRTVDKDALKSLIDKVDSYEEDSYTPNSWKLVKDQLASALDVYEDEAATLEDVQAAEEKLQEAMDALVERADMNDLKALIDEAKAKKEVDFTPNTWAPFIEILGNEVNVFDNKNSTQSDVDNAKLRLSEAMGQLIQRANKVELGSLIEQATKLKKEHFTLASWEVLETNLSAAKDSFDNGNAVQTDVDAIVVNLQAAISGLVEEDAIYSELETVLQSVSKIDRDNYTQGSLDRLDKAIKAIEYDLKKKDQSKVDAMVLDIRNAIDALVLKEAIIDPSGTQKPSTSGTNTGDNTNINLWIILGAFSAGTLIFRKRKRVK